MLKGIIFCKTTHQSFIKARRDIKNISYLNLIWAAYFINTFCFYSGDLNTRLVWIWNGRKTRLDVEFSDLNTRLVTTDFKWSDLSLDRHFVWRHWWRHLLKLIRIWIQRWSIKWISFVRFSNGSFSLECLLL